METTTTGATVVFERVSRTEPHIPGEPAPLFDLIAELLQSIAERDARRREELAEAA
jgi:hypothetical protein